MEVLLVRGRVCFVLGGVMRPWLRSRAVGIGIGGPHCLGTGEQKLYRGESNGGRACSSADEDPCSL